MAIEQLQAELTASRKEEQAIRDEAQRVSLVLRLWCVGFPVSCICAITCRTAHGCGNFHNNATAYLCMSHPTHKLKTSAGLPCQLLAPQICDDQAGELRRAEEQLQQMEAALMSRNQQVSSLQAKVSELEAEVESSRQEQRTFGSVFAAKERDQTRKLEALQDEVRGRALSYCRRGNSHNLALWRVSQAP